MIEIRNLRFGWKKSDNALLDIPALNFASGERAFIKGPSGCGKSTLLNLIGGVLVPQQGDIKVLGQDMQRLSAVKRDQFRADHIGFIFQMFNLLPYLSVLENVTLPLRFSRRRRQRVLARRSIHDEALRLLSHLDMAQPELLQRPVMELSMGQQQRVAAARAVIGGPDLLIADEPTSALDAERREGFIKLLIQECEAENIGLIFVSHDPSLQAYFQQAINLPDINRASEVANV